MQANEMKKRRLEVLKLFLKVELLFYFELCVFKTLYCATDIAKDVITVVKDICLAAYLHRKTMEKADQRNAEIHSL